MGRKGILQRELTVSVPRAIPVSVKLLPTYGLRSLSRLEVERMESDEGKERQVSGREKREGTLASSSLDSLPLAGRRREQAERTIRVLCEVMKP